MIPITEETAVELLRAMQELTAAIKAGGQCQPASVYDGAYVARSIVGGIDGIKAENKRDRRVARRAKP